MRAWRGSGLKGRTVLPLGLETLPVRTSGARTRFGREPSPSYFKTPATDVIMEVPEMSGGPWEGGSNGMARAGRRTMGASFGNIFERL